MDRFGKLAQFALAATGVLVIAASVSAQGIRPPVEFKPSARPLPCCKMTGPDAVKQCRCKDHSHCRHGKELASSQTLSSGRFEFTGWLRKFGFVDQVSQSLVQPPQWMLSPRF